MYDFIVTIEGIVYGIDYNIHRSCFYYYKLKELRNE